jgi:hypothetical protein
LKNKIYAYDSPDAYMANYTRPRGQRFPADHHFSGENKDYGALLQYHFFVEEKKAEEPKEEDKKSKGKKEKKKEKTKENRRSRKERR